MLLLTQKYIKKNLHCPRYANVRNTYLSGYLHTHFVQELLQDKVTATDEDNDTIFCHVQEFIVKSKRFLWYKITNVTLMQIILKESTYGVMEHICLCLSVSLSFSASLSVSLCLCLSLSLSLCIFDVYARARISVCKRLCTCLDAYVYVCMYVCMYVHAHVRAFESMYVRTYVRAYVCM